MFWRATTTFRWPARTETWNNDAYAGDKWGRPMRAVHTINTFPDGTKGWIETNGYQWMREITSFPKILHMIPKTQHRQEEKENVSGTNQTPDTEVPTSIPDTSLRIITSFSTFKPSKTLWYRLLWTEETRRQPTTSYQLPVTLEDASHTLSRVPTIDEHQRSANDTQRSGQVARTTIDDADQSPFRELTPTKAPNYMDDHQWRRITADQRPAGRQYSTDDSRWRRPNERP